MNEVNMEYQNLANKYLEWIAANYDDLVLHFKKFCSHQRYTWDDDIFPLTYVNVYERILKKGLEDQTEKGFMDFTFISFKFNTIGNFNSAGNKRRVEMEDEKLKNLYETYYNATNTTSTVKLLKDLKSDYMALYLAELVEENFDAEHFYLWRLKTFKSLTYKQLQELTGDKHCRQKVLDVKRWLFKNADKKEIEADFEIWLEQQQISTNDE